MIRSAQCLLLVTTLVLHNTNGAAVLDLINLFHQYEDDILGRGQGVNPEPLEIDEETEAEPVARRPTRERRQPAWLRSGEYAQSNQVINSDWSDRAHFLQTLMTQGDSSSMKSDILRAMIDVVKNK